MKWIYLYQGMNDVCKYVSSEKPDEWQTMMYFDFVFANTLIYTAIRPSKRNMLIQTTITPSVGMIISEVVRGVTLKLIKGGIEPPNKSASSSANSCILIFASVIKIFDN